MKNLLNKDFNKLALKKDGKVNESFYPIKTSVYDVHLEEWLEYYSLENIHIIDADILAENPSYEMMKIEKYLGLEPKCTPDKFGKNEKGFYCVQNCECMGEEKGHIFKTSLNKDVNDALMDFYKPQVKHLQKLINRTLSWMPKYLKWN